MSSTFCAQTCRQKKKEKRKSWYSKNKVQKSLQIFRSFHVADLWLWLELPRRSFEGFESAHSAATGDGVVGDLYNSAHSRRRVTAERQKGHVWEGWKGGTLLCFLNTSPLCSIPGRRHHGAPRVPHPAIIGKASTLGAWATVPLLPHSLLPAVTFHYDLATRAERLQRQRKCWMCLGLSHRGKPTQNVKVFHRTGGSGKDITPFSEDKLTWSLITMGLLSSRSLKLLSRLMEWPPLRAGPGPTPGPSLPDRSARMRIGPLLSPARDFKERLAFQNHQATNNA